MKFKVFYPLIFLKSEINKIMLVGCKFALQTPCFLEYIIAKLLFHTTGKKKTTIVYPIKKNSIIDKFFRFQFIILISESASKREGESNNHKKKIIHIKDSSTRRKFLEWICFHRFFISVIRFRVIIRVMNARCPWYG